MKIRASQLELLVNRLVREELERLLPRMVAEHLSREYIRGVVSESRGVTVEPEARPASTPRRAKTRMAEESKRIVSEMVQQQRHALLSDENPLRALYEGVEPLDETVPHDDVDLEDLGFTMSPSVMEKIAGID